MGRLGVAFIDPDSDLGAGGAEPEERALSETFIAKPSVEALHERIPDRLAGLDVVLSGARFLAPAQDRHRGQLGAIVVDDQDR